VSTRCRFERYYFAVGAKPDEIPRLYPIATDETWVFLVLYDPPGSDSTASIAKGSTVTTSMSIAGMHAASLARTSGHSISAGYKVDTSNGFNLFGVTVSNKAWEFQQSDTWSKERTYPAVSVERASSQSFNLEFTFSLGISTSDDPNLAGSPSDVIVGGGSNQCARRGICS
jgi:hypothetical protein